MKIHELLQKAKGTHTIESLMDALQVNKQQAIYYVHRLRKHSYVRTKKLSDHRRVYSISVEHKLGGTSYYDIINRHAPLKIAEPVVHKLYGKQPTLEETFIYALQTKSLRAILAALALFKQMHDWSTLYRLAKQHHVERQVGALYDVARTVMKARKMSARFKTYALPTQNTTFTYIIPQLQSKDFKAIEQQWKVYIPFNKSDLEAYT